MAGVLRARPIAISEAPRIVQLAAAGAAVLESEGVAAVLLVGEVCLASAAATAGLDLLASGADTAVTRLNRQADIVQASCRIVVAGILKGRDVAVAEVPSPKDDRAGRGSALVIENHGVAGVADIEGRIALRTAAALDVEAVAVGVLTTAE